jgi:hypothetical protein
MDRMASENRATEMIQGDVPGQIPQAAGACLKPQHYGDALNDRHSDRRDIQWLEVHAENYMGEGGPALHYLTQLRADYAISVHGVGLSIGGARPLDKTHLRRLKHLVARFEPGLFSEHLAWSTHGDGYFPDLLPLPYMQRTLAHIANHIDEVQEALGMRMLLENPSHYIEFDACEMTEPEFLSELVKRTGCGLLLDVNNVVVSARNLGFDPMAYIADFPMEAVGEIHLAGHTEIEEPDGSSLLIDSHSRPVSQAVWALYARCLAISDPLPTMIEWDRDVPSWQALSEQARRAEAFLDERRRAEAAVLSSSQRKNSGGASYDLAR